MNHGFPHRVLQSQPSPVLHLEDVTRRFGRTWALRGITLTVESGEVVGVEGHNGSGKTTLLRIAATLVRPTSGRVSLCGLDAVQDAPMARTNVAMLTHATGLYDDLTARENLRFAATMLGADAAQIPAVLERLALTREADERVGRFSSGMQRRVALGRLMLRTPRLLLLDEPYNSFDPDGVALVNDVIRSVTSAGGATLVVLHDRGPAAPVLDRCVRLHAGRVRDETPAAKARVAVGAPPGAAVPG